MKAAILKTLRLVCQSDFLAYESHSHEHFVRRCLELAEGGRGRVPPNPLVGCVITKEGKVIAEAWHEKFGGKHAEILAIEKMRNAPLDCARGKKCEMRSLTLYVNLEPCCTHGKTPPCTEAILKTGIRRVVFGARDSSNRGVEVLKREGVEVVGPILEPECRRLNKGFFSLIEQGRPWVTVKKALREDASVPSEHITSNEQDRWSHAHLRATHDAILVGSGTVIADNPKLNIRSCSPKLPLPQYTSILRSSPPPPSPLRIILDPRGEIPKRAAVLTDEDSDRTMVIREKLPIPELLQRLKEKGIGSVLVEGGLRVWKSFEESGCIDEEVIIVGG